MVPVGWIIWGIGAGVVFGTKALYTGICALLAGFVTPKSHRRYGQYSDSKAANELRADRFNITPDFAMNAVAKIKKN